MFLPFNHAWDLINKLALENVNGIQERLSMETMTSLSQIKNSSNGISAILQLLIAGIRMHQCVFIILMNRCVKTLAAFGLLPRNSFQRTLSSAPPDLSLPTLELIPDVPKIKMRPHVLATQPACGTEQASLTLLNTNALIPTQQQVMFLNAAAKPAMVIAEKLAHNAPGPKFLKLTKLVLHYLPRCSPVLTCQASLLNQQLLKNARLLQIRLHVSPLESVSLMTAECTNQKTWTPPQYLLSIAIQMKPAYLTMVHLLQVSAS
jgi:hypothetical protein